MNFPAKCHCGFYHYSFEQWSKVHGESKEFVDPYIQLPFVNNKLWNEKEDWDPINPYPTITWIWVCQFCGEKWNHTADCPFYLEKIKPWEDIKKGIVPASTSTFAPPPPSDPKPLKPPQPPKEDDENTKKTLFEWKKADEITPYQYKKLYSIVDLKKEYTLTELLALLPKKKPKPPTPPFHTPDSTRPPSPEPTDPLLEAIKNTENGLRTVFGNYVVIYPLFLPETEINNKGNELNWWEEETWLEYLNSSKDLEDLKGKGKTVERVFFKVIIEHYLERKDLNAIRRFEKDHPGLWNEGSSIYLDAIKALEKELETSDITWDDALDKIYNKFNGSDKPKNLTQVKEFINKELKILPKSGIEGNIETTEAKKEDLLNLKKGSSNMSLSGAKGEVKGFADWISLDSFRDGNCFLNSFSLLMKGDQSLSTELRVRICIFLMNNPNLMMGLNEKEQLEQLTLKLVGERERDGKTWTLAKRGEWLATDDISLFSEMIQRPIRVLYKPNQTQFKDFNAYTQFGNITGGWAKLEYYDPEKKQYKTDNWWTICHVGKNHFEPLIPNKEDKALPPTEINIIFTKLINGVQSVIRGEVNQSNFLMSRDFENQLALLDSSYRQEILNQIRHVIFGVIGLEKPINREKLKMLGYWVGIIVEKLLEISKLYNGNGETAKPDLSNSENYVDIYFEATDAFLGGRLMITVASRPDGKTHIIGEPWKNDGSFMNIYNEETDPQPKKFKGKELKRVFLDLDDTKAKEYEKKVKDKGYKHIIFRVKGEIDTYDPPIKSLTFKEGSQVELEVKFPL